MATLYVVLFNDDGDKLMWQNLGAFEGTTAARQAALKHGKDGSYVAVPARSWDPVALAIETNPRVKVVK